MLNDTLASIGELLEPIFVQNAVIRAFVFGSYARGDETPDSDIDFLVEFADGASILNLCCLIEDIKDTINRPAGSLIYVVLTSPIRILQIRLLLFHVI
jgi:hypothetical protein